MPNWCSNIVEVIGDAYDIQALVEVKMDFEELHPSPMFDETDSYQDQQAKLRKWMIDNWGTSWELDTDNIDIHYDSNNPTQAKFSFDTAWQPCCEFLLHLSTKMPLLVIRHKFYESGDNIVGDITYANGEFMHNDIPSVRKFVLEQFGEDYNCTLSDDDGTCKQDPLTTFWKVKQPLST